MLTYSLFVTVHSHKLQYNWVHFLKLRKFLKFKKMKRAYVWNNKKIYWSGIYKTSLFWEIKIDILNQNFWLLLYIDFLQLPTCQRLNRYQTDLLLINNRYHAFLYIKNKFETFMFWFMIWGRLIIKDFNLAINIQRFMVFN